MLKRVGALASLTLTATVSGLVREAVIAYSLGTTATADALAIGIFLIDLVNTLFLTGGLGYAFVPVIKRVRQTQGESNARLLVAALVTRIGIVALLLVIGSLFLLHPLLSSLRGLGSGSVESVAIVLQGSILAVGVMIVASSLAAALYGFENFVAAACARVGWNGAIVVSLLLLSRLSRDERAASALVLASVVALTISVLAMRRLGRQEWTFEHPELRSVMIGAAPGIVSVFVGNLLLGFWERSLLAQLGEGSIAVVNYALRASNMASTLSLAVHTIAFNEIVAALHAGGQARLRQLVQGVLRRMLIFLGPLAAIMVIAREPIIALLYGRGAFGVDSVHVTSTVFGLYALDVVPVFILGILLRVLYAVERPWTASLPTVVMAVVAAVADWLLIGELGVRAIPIGYGLGLIAGIGTALLQIRALMRLRLAAAVVRSSMVSAALACAGGVVAFLVFGRVVDATYAANIGVQRLLMLALLIFGETVVVAVVVLVCARAWQMRELAELMAYVRARRAGAQQVAT